VNVDDDLLLRAKELAARSRRSLGEIVDDALRVLFAAGQGATSTRDLDLPTYGGSGLRPGVDLEDKDAVAALLDEGASNAAG
jgi:hypothetical protein